MKKDSFSIINSISAVSNMFYQLLLGNSKHKLVALPTQPSSYNHNIKNRKSGFMKNITGLHKTVLLLVTGLLFTAGSLMAQVINESFEEADWQTATANPNNNKSTTGSVVIGQTSASNTLTYYLSPTSTESYTFVTTTKGGGTKTSKSTSTLTSTGVNTSPNSGTWWYSKGNTGSDNRLQRVHSASHSWEIGTSGYLITPIIQTGIATVTFWVAPADNFFVGANTITAAPTPQNYNSATTSNGYTLGVSTYPSNGTGNTTFMQSFSYSTAVTSPYQLGFFSQGGNIYIDDISISVNQGTQASVSTGTYTSLTYTSATIPGTITANDPAPNAIITSSGVCYSATASLPDTSNSFTVDGPSGVASGAILSTIQGLTPNTHYCARAYAITTAGIVYGSTTTCFTTLAPTTPTLTTIDASNVLATKATSGGNISDSGGVAILQEGVCWSTTSGAETATSGTNYTSDGTSGITFSSLIKSLQPSTTYYVKAYAKNSIGLSYASNEISFTTPVAGPTISASTETLTFPTVQLNSTPKVLSFTLSATNLTPAADTITIAAPAGFLVSTSPGGGFTDSLLVPYSSNTLANTKVYVQQITTSYAANSNDLIFSGGGAQNPNIDTVLLVDNVVQNPDVLTNLGTDFWVGHGLEEHMDSKNGYGLQVYIATGAQAATVTVSIPGIPSFTPQVYTIDPNSVQIVSGFPTGDANDPKNAKGLPDARLYYTGTSNRGIHVEVTNNVPVAVFLYDYATNNSAGGSMVFPTNTWNSSYIVQTYGGATSNTGIPNTYFFVMAKEDNTVVTFKPTAPILDSISSPVISGKVGGTIAYDVNTSTGYQVTLNKGQVFNAVGLVDATTKVSYDLTGTIVTSDCNHPISVFAGNSRTLINAPGLNCTPTTGSDNLIQQMFPKVAWGTKYLTVPTKTMEYNLFRIGVQDTATIVTVDSTVLDKATLNTTGLYYEIEGNTCRKITSNNPITVTQFILPGKACANATVGNNGTGDPEMILLSPVQQSIKSTTVYTSDFKNGHAGGAYINVVIPTSGVASFRLDTALNPTQWVDTGASSYLVDSFGVSHAYYPADTLVPIAKAFTPFAQDSSYSWAKFFVTYPAVHTLSSNVGFNAIAYGVADGESWGYNAGTSIQDLTAIVTANTPYGVSPFPITCKGNSTGINISLPYDPAKVFSIQWVSANDPSVIPANDTANGSVTPTGSFVKDGITYYTFKSPKNYTFDSLGSFKFSVTASGIFTNECGGSKTFDVVMNVLRDTTNFSFAPISCGSATFKFKDQTRPIQGDTITKWQWAFGTSNNDSSYVQNPTFTFPSSATYQVKLRAINNIGCFTDTMKKVAVTILAPPVADFSMPASVCIPTGNVQFTNKSDTAVSGKLTYAWNFGDGNGASTSKDPSYTYKLPNTAGYTVQLIATSIIGCKDTSKHVLAVETPPTHSIITSSSTPSNTILAGQTITLTDDIANGIWVNTDNSVASLDSLANTAKVKGLTKGEDIILYIQPSKVCKSDTATFALEVIPSDVFIPNLFSPNNDGHNDVFYVRGSSVIYKEVHLWVFSSWGNQVFESKGGIDNSSNGWDGKYNGQEQPTGAYVYVAKLTKVDGTVITRKGSITLIR